MSIEQPQEQSFTSTEADKTKLKIKSKSKNYLKYSGWGYTLFGLMLVSIFIGQKADAYFELEEAYITLSLLGIVIFSQFYKLIRDLA